jgi:hypothetical protein
MMEAVMLLCDLPDIADGQREQKSEEDELPQARNRDCLHVKVLTNMHAKCNAASRLLPNKGNVENF